MCRVFLYTVAISSTFGLASIGCNPTAEVGGSEAPGRDASASGDAGVSGDGGVTTSADAREPDGPLASEFDLGLDFSFSSNPNGAWRYGYTRGPILAVDQFLLDTFGIDDDAAVEGFWHPTDAGGGRSPNANPSDGGGGYYPYVAQNHGPATTVYQSSWALRAGEVAMEASNGGQYSAIEFVAPQSGAYQVQVHFAGLHFQLSTTDVHVRQNDTELFASDIAGYGGDPAFHPVQGKNPAADYQATVPMVANDVMTFAVGYGTDKTNYNDTTGLFVHLVLLKN